MTRQIQDAYIVAATRTRSIEHSSVSTGRAVANQVAA